MMKIISYLNSEAIKLVNRKIPTRLIEETGIFDRIIKIKYDVANDKLELLDEYFTEIDQALLKVE